MEYLRIFLTSIGSFAALFCLTKIMGEKQMSQLSMFDYIIGITIGSIAAEMATSLENDFTKPLLAMVIYGLSAWLISYLCTKSFSVRRLFTGKASVLYNNGKLYEENFKKAKMEIGEFLMLSRNSGYFNLSSIETIILEANGKLSFLPKASDRPATPADFNLSPANESVFSNIIEDGKIMYQNLKNTGLDDSWLKKELKRQNIKSEDVFLGVCGINKELIIYKKTGKDIPKDILE